MGLILDEKKLFYPQPPSSSVDPDEKIPPTSVEFPLVDRPSPVGGAQRRASATRASSFLSRRALPFCSFPLPDDDLPAFDPAFDSVSAAELFNSTDDPS